MFGIFEHYRFSASSAPAAPLISDAAERLLEFGLAIWCTQRQTSRSW